MTCVRAKFLSESGWMDQELFSNWFLHQFLKHAVSTWPILLMLDGHSSHYNLDLVQSAAENDVIIFCLPPHTTADSQPLDTSCFGPLKVYWSEACRQFMFNNPGRVVSKFQFLKLFSEAWSKGISINNITSGFRSTGIYPFNRSAVLDILPQTAEVAVAEDDNADGSSSDEECDDDEHLDDPPPPSPPAEPDANLDGHQASLKFPPDKMDLYERRFENGYDVFTDSDYVAWLQIYHPESAPLTNILSSVTPLQSVEGK